MKMRWAGYACLHPFLSLVASEDVFSFCQLLVKNEEGSVGEGVFCCIPDCDLHAMTLSEASSPSPPIRISSKASFQTRN